MWLRAKVRALSTSFERVSVGDAIRMNKQGSIDVKKGKEKKKVE